MKELIKSVNAVMKEFKSVSKNSNVGVGRSAYKGVRDLDVKQTVQPLLAKHGLALFQTSMNVETSKTVWEETYNNQAKRKQQVFVEVKCKYRLIHSSGEFMDLEGLGHGVDTQDKAAGKAQTYALKMIILYTFLVPVGEIDDTDITHSNEHEVAPPKQQPKKQQPKQKKPLSDEERRNKFINDIANDKLTKSNLTPQQKRVAAGFIIDIKEQSYWKVFTDITNSYQGSSEEILTILENATAQNSEGLREYVKALNENNLPF